MNRKLQLMTAAAVVFVLGAGTQLAIAQSDQRAGTIQSAPARNTARISRPVDSAALPRNRDFVATALTKDECKGIGGVVGDATAAARCSTGRACYTAGADGVVRSMCITE